MLLESILIAIIAAFYIGFKDGHFDAKKTLLTYGFLGVLCTIGTYIYLYFFTPSFVGVIGGYYRVAVLPILFVSIICLSKAVSSNSSGIEAGIQMLKILVVSGVFIYLAFTPISHNQQLYNIPNVTVHDNISDGSNFAPIDAQNMRIIDQSMAYYLGNKVIGGSDNNLGSQYEVKESDFTIQNVNNRLYWVAPLEFRGIFKWWSLHSSPGFIMVDAKIRTKLANFVLLLLRLSQILPQMS
ncbi:MAG: hypothetical protein PHH48_06540 [Eubacteriales bacterium]|nr:hypothetical protein [Eubacteriales bacterium]